jgi:hypothetical protein
VFRDFAPAASEAFDIEPELELAAQLGAITARGILRPMIVRFAPAEAVLRPKRELSCRLWSETCRLFQTTDDMESTDGESGLFSSV